MHFFNTICLDFDLKCNVICANIFANVSTCSSSWDPIDTLCFRVCFQERYYVRLSKWPFKPAARELHLPGSNQHVGPAKLQIAIYSMIILYRLLEEVVANHILAELA